MRDGDIAADPGSRSYRTLLPVDYIGTIAESEHLCIETGRLPPSRCSSAPGWQPRTTSYSPAGTSGPAPAAPSTGLTRTRVSTASTETDGADETQTIGRLVAGYRFMPWFGLEAIYQTLGTYRIRVEGPSAGTALALDRVAEVDAYAVAALGHYPLKRGSFFARLGAARWRVESATTYVAGGVVQRREDEERGSELVWGLGYEHLIANGALRIGYEEIANVAIDPDEDDLRLIAFDVLLRF